MAETLSHQLKGPTHFLRLDRMESNRLLTAIRRLLPSPRPIVFQPGAGTTLYGFPVLATDRLATLDASLTAYLDTEATRERALGDGPLSGLGSVDAAVAAAWQEYAAHLVASVRNVAGSSYAQDYPHIFWLEHSRAIASHLASWHSGGASRDALRYHVLERYLGRVFELLYELVAELATESEQQEEELFPALLPVLRDNVLILTEERVGPRIDELRGYFNGYLGLDADDMLTRWQRIESWSEERLRREPDMRAAVSNLLPAPPSAGALFQRGYMTYLSSLRAWDEEAFFDERGVRRWEGLLERLQEFELLNELRRLVVRVAPEGDLFHCDPRDAERIGAGRGVISTRTRPIDFMAPWLVDPEVSRGGLMYDLTDFTAVVTNLDHGPHDRHERAFRRLFRFQRHLNRLAHRLRLRFEKYLGDGAFFTAMEIPELLIASIEMQRYYRRALASGFPFDRGMRIALNYGDYRLVPFSDERSGAERYEAFGQGVVELTRLVSGKWGAGIREMEAELLSRGYQPDAVDRFFAPLRAEHAAIAETSEPERQFACHIDSEGRLVNEGIAATLGFLKRWQAALRGDVTVAPWKVAERTYLAIDVALNSETYRIAIRRLGQPTLKGIGALVVYEVLDLGEADGMSDRAAIPSANLVEEIDKRSASRARPRRRSS